MVSGMRGLSLAELLIATAIILTITALASVLAVDAHTMWRADSARIDLQQRRRIAADVLTRTLLEAGAGPYTGTAKGPLVRTLAPVAPRRTGLRTADPPRTFREDAISVLHTVAEAEHATLLLPAAPGTTVLDIATASCRLPACGFTAGSSLLVHDSSGNYDVFTVTGAGGTTLTVRHLGPGTAATYPPGSAVVRVESRSLYLDGSARLLRSYDGDASDLPLLDDVVGMHVQYAGTPAPPSWPRPPAGEPNCLYEADGTFRSWLMPVLPAQTSLVGLGDGILTDGPWCGAGVNQFDADLLRLRQIRVTLRLQAADPAVRGIETMLFRYPGTARASAALVPDTTVVVDVVPPNLRQPW